MDLNLKKKEPLPQGLKRLAKSVVEEAIELSQLKGRKRHFAVHEIRKRLKEMRALLRMVRLEIGEEVYKRENVLYRDAGRLISDMRDATSLIEIVKKLEERYKPNVKKELFDEVKTQLANRRRVMTRKILTNQKTLEEVRSMLKKGLGRIKLLPIPEDSWALVSESMKKVYSRGFEAYNEILKNPTAENHHEWRKRVKYLMYQLRFIESAWPEILSAFEEQFNSLSDFLGDDHDLAVLQEHLEKGTVQFKRKTDRELFESLVESYSDSLREQAMILGERLYAEEPGMFKERFETYLESPRTNGKA